MLKIRCCSAKPASDSPKPRVPAAIFRQSPSRPAIPARVQKLARLADLVRRRRSSVQQFVGVAQSCGVGTVTHPDAHRQRIRLLVKERIVHRVKRLQAPSSSPGACRLPHSDPRHRTVPETAGGGCAAASDTRALVGSVVRAMNGSCCVYFHCISGGNGCSPPGVVSRLPLTASSESRISSASSRRGLKCQRKRYSTSFSASAVVVAARHLVRARQQNQPVQLLDGPAIRDEPAVR